MTTVVMVYLRLRNFGALEANIALRSMGGREENQDFRVGWIRI